MLILYLDSRWFIDTDLDADDVVGFVPTEAMLIHNVQEEWYLWQSEFDDFVRTNVEIRKLSKH